MVPEKSGNSRVMPEDSMEGRGVVDGKDARGNAGRTLSREPCGHVTERIGRKAKEDKGTRFNNLLSHLKVPLLREAYEGLRRDAATGIDGQTWQEYGNDLEARLSGLEGRLQRGSYHPPPVRRVHISKGDGKKRPLGIPTLEDKIAQQAVRMLLEPIYEQSEFLGFSYGYRRGRSAHQALGALEEAINRKVNWVLDADIRSFFDTIDHEWMRKFIEHRIADGRLVRLLMKWLKAGVMEDGQRREVERGTPQGGIISPLLANLYLHHALDQWAHQWRKRNAGGEMYIVRYADDVVIAFQHEKDARRLREELGTRLATFGLTLHPEKTRILRFGRFAERDSVLDGRSRPETFDFLGFTHISAKNSRGNFRLVRRTSRKKRAAKLAQLSDEIERRKHHRVVDQHRWLSQVLRGHYQYYGVSTNYRALKTVYATVRRCWHTALQRRSQRAKWSRDQRERFDQRFPLPPPRIMHPQLPRPCRPSTGDKSPVREIRPPGSVRGAR
jgi:RNA-directed DNA polymerase